MNLAIWICLNHTQRQAPISFCLQVFHQAGSQLRVDFFAQWEIRWLSQGLCSFGLISGRVKPKTRKIGILGFLA